MVARNQSASKYGENMICKMLGWKLPLKKHCQHSMWIYSLFQTCNKHTEKNISSACPDEFLSTPRNPRKKEEKQAQQLSNKGSHKC